MDDIETTCLKPRRELRIPVSDEKIELLPIIHSETIDFKEFITFFASDDSNLVKSAIFTLEWLIDENYQLPCLIETISDLIEPLYSFILKSEKLIEDNDVENPQYHDVNKIASMSSNLLINIFSMDIPSDSSHNESFFSHFIEQISTPQEMEMLFCISRIVIDANPELMRTFYQSKCYEFISTLPILQLEPNVLESLAALIPICIDPYFDYQLQVPTKLLLQLIQVLDNAENFDPKVIDNCAFGCYKYVISTQNQNKAMALFLINGIHIKLLQVMPKMTTQGQSYAISALGHCYSCESEVYIEDSLLSLFVTPSEEENEIRSQTFNIDEILLEDIPLEIFATALEIEDDSIRLNMVNAIYNIMFKANMLVELLLQSQLFAAMMNHFVSDAFIIKLRLLDAFILLYQNIPPQNLPYLIHREFFETLEGMIETDNPNIEQKANELFVFVKKDEVELGEENEAIIQEFEDFLFTRLLSN